MSIHISPPFIATKALVSTLQTVGYAVLSPTSVVDLWGSTAQDRVSCMVSWPVSWNDLPADAYLKDGGHYRRRRHSCFVVNRQNKDTAVLQTPHRAHWQPLEYNALHGGMQRMFDAMSSQVVQSPAWAALLSKLGDVCTALKPGTTTWFVEAHQFRIDTTDGIGRPTPEGAHRDGVDFVAVMLIARHGIKGGETRVFDVACPTGQRFTMTEPWTLLLLDDEQVIHESTPIQPLDTTEKDLSYRDTLVLTFRAGAFQGEEGAS